MTYSHQILYLHAISKRHSQCCVSFFSAYVLEIWNSTGLVCSSFVQNGP